MTTLFSVLNAIAEGTQTDVWSDADSKDRVLKQIGPLGLTKRTADHVELTDLGRGWVADPTREDLFRILHARIAYFGEALAVIASRPTRAENLREDAVIRYLMAWTSLDQIRRRLAWLQALGLIEAWGDRTYKITEAGTVALGLIELQPPGSVGASTPVEATEDLPPAPSALASAIASADISGRLISWPYLTNDPSGLLSLIASQTANAATKDDLVATVSRQFQISPTSAKGAVDATGQIGLYEYAGKFTVTATAIGREWSDHASPLNLVRLLHARYLAVGEVLRYVGDAPRSAGEIHREVFQHYEAPPKQSRTAGVLRLLAAAGAVAPIGHARYVLTNVGRALATELPLYVPSESVEGSSAPQNVVNANGADAIVLELEISSRDVAHPDRFEKACASAFTFLGVEAQHLGGPGRTDVLVEIRSNLELLARAIVDAKSASGSLNENSIKFDALREHAAKHDATLTAVVAPSYEGSGRLADWATSNSVVLITASELGGLVYSHQESPYSAIEIVAILTVGGRHEVEARRAQAIERLALMTGVIAELLTEQNGEHPEPISARDIGRAMRRAGTGVTDVEVAGVLEFLAQPDIAAVEANSGEFTLPSSPSVAAARLRSLAHAIESAGS